MWKRAGWWVPLALIGSAACERSLGPGETPSYPGVDEVRPIDEALHVAGADRRARDTLVLSYDFDDRRLPDWTGLDLLSIRGGALAIAATAPGGQAGKVFAPFANPRYTRGVMRFAARFGREDSELQVGGIACPAASCPMAPGPRVRFSGGAVYVDDGTWVDTGIRYAHNKWYDVKVELDNGSGEHGQFTLRWADRGDPTVTTLGPFDYGSTPPPTDLRFFSFVVAPARDHGHAAMLLDDVHLEVDTGDAPPPVCTDFNDGTLQGWTVQAATAVPTAPSGDGTEYMRCGDLPSPPTSAIIAPDAFDGDWVAFRNLTFDIAIFEDGWDVTNELTVTVQIEAGELVGKGVRAAFVLETPITEPGGSNPGWHSVVAPIYRIDDLPLPGNAYGHWVLRGQITDPVATWNQLIQNVGLLWFPGDVNSSPSQTEDYGVDNVCLE